MPGSGKPAHESGDADRLVAVTLDAESLNNPSPDIEHERRVAIYDLLQANRFRVIGREAGPYRLHLAIAENRLVFDISGRDDARCAMFGLSLTPFRRLVKDYFLVCESYFQAIRSATPSQIEAIDMGRRGLHDEGSGLLRERLDGKIELDHDTSRRLFTLVCVLHWRG